ncbi:unnamed protein product [Amaranthus hypochondriacus]
MDYNILGKGLDLAKKREKWVLLLALFGVSSYGAYKVYNLPKLTSKRKSFSRLLRTFCSVFEMVSESADTIGLVSRDLKVFLASDSNEIPNSLRQISKIVMSDEFSDSLTRVSQNLTVGVSRGYYSVIENRGELGDSVSLADRVMDRIMSNVGTGFASVLVGSFARNLVLGFRSNHGNRMEDLSINGVDSFNISKWVNLVCTDKSKELIGNCIQVFVSTAVAVYLEKTLDINFYNDVFAGLTNPNHESKLKDILVTVCNGAVETLIKTSHQVLTSKNTNPSPSSSSSSRFISDVEHSYSNGCDFGYERAKTVCDPSDEKVDSGSWGSMITSTLSIPSNRRFVLDVTGRVTFETCRSLLEFSLFKISDGLRSSHRAVHDRVKDKGRQVITYFGLRSYVILTICLALYLHIVCGNKALLPA